jgi:hypothetical protein
MKKIAFILSIFYASSSLAITLNLNEEGEVSYSLNDTTRYSHITLNEKIQDLENTRISISLSYQNNAYRIFNLKNKKVYNDFFLTINSIKNVYLGRKEKKEDERSTFTFKRLKLVGTRADQYATCFINHWDVTITADQNSYDFRRVSLQNYAQITFQGDAVFPLVTYDSSHTCFFRNYGTSIFRGEFKCFTGTQPESAAFQYQADKNCNLRNFGLIACDKSIWLSGNIYIGETGQILARGGINYEYDKRNKKRLQSITRNVDYPISSITRIPEDLADQHRTIPSGELSELCALDFYKRWRELNPFRYKANSSENGIDVWAYSDNQVFLHESKNYQQNGYSLDKDQMTKRWLLGHLLDGFQAIVKDQYLRLQYGERGGCIDDSIQENMKKLYSILVKEPYKPLVYTATKEAYHDDVKELLKLKVEPNSLEDIEEIFDYSLVAGQGNSIYHTPLSLINQVELDFEIPPPLVPTYLFVRDLKKRISS